jgi:Domain of unknown function (DUF4314)
VETSSGAAGRSAERGQRIRLIAPGPPPGPGETRLPAAAPGPGPGPGDEGTVLFTDSLGTVHVRWDRGFQLGLTPGHDHWELPGDQA